VVYSKISQGIENTKICQKDYQRKCYNGNVYSYDSCGQRQGVYKYCSNSQKCINGECINNQVKSSSTAYTQTTGKFNSAPQIINSIKTAAPEMSTLDLSYISSIGSGKVVGLVKKLFGTLTAGQSEFISFTFDMATCLQKKGAYDGILYYSRVGAYPSLGIIFVLDEYEIKNVENYIKCISSYILNNQAMSIYGPPSYQISYCKWTIDDRFVIVYSSLTEKNNDIKNKICNSLGGCKSCNVKYIS
jgi:hypothetical protein